ncbi:MAG: hypothetical protein ACLFNU_03290 [Bacteroidales bacterium]
MMRPVAIILLYLIISFSAFSQDLSLIVTLNPNDCGNYIREVHSSLDKVSNDFRVNWLLEESYIGQQEKLEKVLNISLDNTVYSDSLYNELTRKGSTANIYQEDSMLFSIPIYKINSEVVGLINALNIKKKKKEIFQFPDSILFSNNNLIKKEDDNYLILDNTYNELFLRSKNKVFTTNGYTLFNKEVYYDVFKDYSYFDSLSKHIEGIKEIAYDRVKISNITFNDTTIDLFCEFPLLKRFDFDKENIGVYTSPAIVKLDFNLNYLYSINLESLPDKVNNNETHHLSPFFFEYFNDGYIISMFSENKEVSDETRPFGKLNIKNSSKEIIFSFLDMSIPKSFQSIHSVVQPSYIYSDLPIINHSLLPIEYDVEKQTVTTRDFKGFSYENVESFLKGDFSNTSIFVINTLYRNDDFLLMLYSKNRKNFKEIYDLSNGTSVYRHKYDGFVIDDRKSTIIPSGWNKAIYLDKNNQIVEVTF